MYNYRDDSGKSLKRFVVVLVVLDDQMLVAVLVGGDDAGLALVEAGTGARPVHFVARNFVFGVGEVADFELAGAPESRDEPHVCREEKEKKMLERKNR